ncbi:MAG TPA: prolipoprotein diacylglyceryl transferase family protein, partial [Usitatibacter sp.]|nr:prolipoprotein diacylglyceryl transferase family protein [Usitatibacter sp.]
MGSAIAFGPFVVALQSVLLACAGLVALVAGWLVGRRDRVGIARVLLDMFVAGMVAARLAFVAEWLDLYREAPWAMLDIRDGGFTPWAGIAAALAVAAWTGW